MLRFVIFFVGGLSAFASAAEIDLPVTFEKVTAYLAEHPEIRSIDAFLPALPESFRANFTLMHHSNSLQSATPEKPRAILYGADARFIVAFTGDPQSDRYDSLEMMQFRDDRNAFELHEVRFPEKDLNKKVEVSEANPTLCLKCHYQDPRPNWEHYSDWPGAFGEDDDENRFAQNAELAKRVQDFLKVGESQPRYRHIPELARSYEYDERDSFRTRLVHNINFTQRVAQLNFRRMARLMSEAPHYAEFKYAALAASACNGSLDKYLTDYVRKQLPELERTYYYSGPEAMPGFFKALGADTRSWSMDFVAKEPGFTTPGNSWSEFVAVFAQSDPDLLPFVKIERSEYAGIPWVRGNALDGGCANLQQKSQDALANLEL